MKFRDPKTGEVFDDFHNAFTKFCSGKACKLINGYKCPLIETAHVGETCLDWATKHQAEAARLMGYEIIESEDESEDGVEICQKVKEVNMKKKDKPRLAEVLGVEVGERFRVPGNGGTVTFWVTDAGYFDTDPPHLAGSTYMLLNAINHPERIIRAPRLTEAELERCRVYGAKYLARDTNSVEVVMYEKKPEEVYDGSYGGGGYIGSIDCRLFPSVHPGNCICVEEVGE